MQIEMLVRDTADLVRKTLSAEVVLDLEPPADEGKSLIAQADINQLQQVLVNLALNARDASQPPAPITFRLRQALFAGELPAFPENVPPGDYVVVEVEDQGSGMPAEVLSQALDPFFTTKEVGQGTGLGLPVAFGIVRGHQGFLTIDSQPGRGTCVGLYLPRLANAEFAIKTQDADSNPARVPAAVPTRDILIIDDEAAVLEVVRRFLEIAGHRVRCANSGREAVAGLDDGHSVDLVILDLMIPREEGAATIARLREARPGLPILVCTGLLQTDRAPAPVQTDGVHVLRKPFRMDKLWDAVNEALARKTS